MIPDHPQRDYRHLRVLVMGLGSFGGGLGVVRFLADHGADITITDTRPAEKLSETLAGLRDVSGLTFRLGGHDEADFRHAELVVVNPAVRRDNPYLEAARSAGVPLTSEMNLFWQWNPAPVVAVTGSNGKSTTTALIHSILQHSKRRAWLGGNLGVSLLPQVAQIRPDDVVVLELSSFQLTDLDRLQVSPAVSVITNFVPNHLDWHESLDHYRWAKQTMFRWQKPTDVAVLNADDPGCREWPTVAGRMEFGLHDTGGNGVFAGENGRAVIRLPDDVRLPEVEWSGQRVSGQEQSFPISEWLRLPGRHNLSNALAAACAALQFDVDESAIRRGLEQYQPLPHRLQWVAEINGRSFYNDSLATTPESAIVALEAFEAPVILMAGGFDKHVDLSQLARTIARRSKAVALMGQTAATLRALIADATVEAKAGVKKQGRNNFPARLAGVESSSPQSADNSLGARRLDPSHTNSIAGSCLEPVPKDDAKAGAGDGDWASRCIVSPELASFRQALDWALAQSAPGDVVLLSPGCASYDWFLNFADRGRQFVEFVQSLANRDR